jgi:chemotaxis protein MotB
MRVRFSFAIPVVALALSACVSQSDYDRVVQENEQLKAQIASLQEQQKWVEAADMLFPAGGWQLTPEGQTALDQLVLHLVNLNDAKIVVYGYTDDTPVGPELQRQGIANNLDLSSKRAGAVVTYLASRGVDPSIMSAKGRGGTHPVAANDTPEDRAKNRRIEIILEGPGARQP